MVLGKLVEFSLKYRPVEDNSRFEPAKGSYIYLLTCTLFSGLSDWRFFFYLKRCAFSLDIIVKFKKALTIWRRKNSTLRYEGEVAF